MKQKILAVDDEPDILEALTIILESSDYDVATSASIDSVDQVIKVKPDLILLDMLLVGQSGVDICKKLKADSRTKQIPVILLSANPVSKLKTLSKDCGADSYLPKPFDITTLLATIHTLLSSC